MTNEVKHETIDSINPTTGQVNQSYPVDSPDTIEKKIQAAQESWLAWKQTSFEERSKLLLQLSKLLKEQSRQLAELMATEMGKPVSQGRAEVEKCALACEYYAAHAEQLLKDQLVETAARKSYIAFRPLGVVLAVMPWNYPFWQVFRFLAPALAAGNCGILKHASNVPGCALAIEKLVAQAGFPPNAFTALLIKSSEVNRVIDHPHVKAVTLTGSNAAGAMVAKRSGELIKKTVLELGGSDPYIVLEDADLDLAVHECVEGRLVNSGQSCIAKRFIVVRPIIEEFTRRFVDAMKDKKMGDPMDEKTEIGPLARIDLRDDLHKQVMRSVELGAVCLTGGTVERGQDAFYPPTVLARVRKGMPAFDEEMFGPVAAIIEADDEQDAIRLANDSIFGLGSAVFTRDVARGERIAANEIEAGLCYVNAQVKSDPKLPFGGVKQSGYGRELSSFGIYEFVNIKTVYVM